MAKLELTGDVPKDQQTIAAAINDLSDRLDAMKAAPASTVDGDTVAYLKDLTDAIFGKWFGGEKAEFDAARAKPADAGTATAQP